MKYSLPSLARLPGLVPATLALLAVGFLALIGVGAEAAPGKATTPGTVLQTNLVSDLPGIAAHTDANLAADVLIGLRQHDLSISSATVQKPTLDEVFMALTGHAAEDHQPEPEMEPAR